MIKISTSVRETSQCLLVLRELEHPDKNTLQICTWNAFRSIKPRMTFKARYFLSDRRRSRNLYKRVERERERLLFPLMKE